MQPPVSIPTTIRSKTTKTKEEHTMATAIKDVSLNKKVSQFFWRSWAIQASWNYERQMNMGFLYGMVTRSIASIRTSPTPSSSLLRKRLTTVTWRSTTAPRRRALLS